MAATYADETFERLYTRYGREVYRYALALLRNPSEAEDVTQTTFLNAYRALRAGERPRRPHNWLIAIAHNVCRSRVRFAMRRPKEVPLDDVVEQLAVPEGERPNIRELLRTIRRLPFNQRAAITMRELEGRSYVDIAETLGVTVPAAEALIGRARRTLRAHASAFRGLLLLPFPRKLAENGEAAGGAVGTAVAAKVAALIVVGAIGGGVGVAAGGGSHAPSAYAEAAPGAAHHFVSRATTARAVTSPQEAAPVHAKAAAASLSPATAIVASEQPASAAPGTTAETPATAVPGTTAAVAETAAAGTTAAGATQAITTVVSPVPTVTTPPITTPAATTPAATTPPATTPPVTTPVTTVPPVTVPTVTVPSVTVPTVTLP